MNPIVQPPCVKVLPVLKQWGVIAAYALPWAKQVVSDEPKDNQDCIIPQSNDGSGPWWVVLHSRHKKKTTDLYIELGHACLDPVRRSGVYVN